MNINTGEMRAFVDIPEAEKDQFVPLTNNQAKRFEKMNPEGRLEAYKNEQRHKQKQIEKRRKANKRKGKK